VDVLLLLLARGARADAMNAASGLTARLDEGLL
jgi:hypothetical protein